MRFMTRIKFFFILNIKLRCLRFSLFMGLIVVYLSGCAASGTGPQFELHSPKSDTAIIYHYRLDAFKGSAMSYDALSNSKPLVHIGNGGYFKEIVSPIETPIEIEYRTKLTQDHGFNFPITMIGNVIINALAEFKIVYKLDVEAGKKYFLKWTPQIFKKVPSIELVPEETAINEIANLRAFSPLSTKPPQ